MEDYGYIDKLAEKLSAYFDIEKDWQMENLCCDLYASPTLRMKNTSNRKPRYTALKTMNTVL